MHNWIFEMMHWCTDAQWSFLERTEKKCSQKYDFWGELLHMSEKFSNFALALKLVREQAAPQHRASSLPSVCTVLAVAFEMRQDASQGAKPTLWTVSSDEVPTLKGHEPVPAIDKAIVRLWQGKRPSAMERNSIRDLCPVRGRQGSEQAQTPTNEKHIKRSDKRLFRPPPP